MVDEVAKAPPSAWVPTRDPVELAILGKMLEELGELTSIVSRCLIQGIDECEPVTGKNNREELMKELGDVSACRKALVRYYLLDQTTILDRADAKYGYQAEWHNMLRKQFPDQVGA